MGGGFVLGCVIVGRGLLGSCDGKVVCRSQVVVGQCKACEVDSVDKEEVTTVRSGSSRRMNVAPATKDDADRCVDDEKIVNLVS